MDLNNLTFAVEGNVFLDDFGKAIRDFELLIRRLSDEYRGTSPIDWEVTEIVRGSALITIGSLSKDQAAVSTVVRAYADIGSALEAGRLPNYPKHILQPAQRLAALPNGRISSVRFQTPEFDAIISSHRRESDEDEHAGREWHGRPRRRWSYGAVEGRIQTLSSRQALTFTLFDSLNDKAVTCYLTSTSKDRIGRPLADYWDKRAIVTGKVYRDPVTHRAITIREITGIRVIDDYAPGQYRRALGVDRASPEDPAPEAFVRQIRDAI